MLYIRVDMNPVIATGHLMRCLSIAEAAVELGEKVIFISADDYPTQLVADHGFENIVLGTDWQDMESELPSMETLISENSIDVLLIDSYQVTERYLAELNKLTKVFYIDDLNKCRHYVTGLINYACYAEDMDYDVPDTIYYKGCSYAPLRKMFRDCCKRERKHAPEKILVMSGGTDPCDMLGRTLTVLRDKMRLKYKEITVICGRYYTNIDGLKDIASQGGSDFEKTVNIIPSVENMREYLENADIVISAGGTTMYEVCAVGVPTISFAIADNQLQNVEWLNDHEIVPCVGDARVPGAEGRLPQLLEHFDDIEVLKGYSNRMQELVDGQGAVRVAGLLIEAGK